MAGRALIYHNQFDTLAKRPRLKAARPFSLRTDPHLSIPNLFPLTR